MERVRKHIEGFVEINTSANTVKSAAERILSHAKLMEEGLTPQVQSILDEVVRLKEAAAKA